MNHTMNINLYDTILDAPIIGTVKDEESLNSCLQNENIKVVFLLFGNILTIEEYVSRIHDAGKIAMVHLDVMNGLQCARDISVDFVKNATGADGIITTHPNCVRRAKELGLWTVLRLFVLDSKSLENVSKQAAYAPDFLEILPGVLPDMIQKITEITEVPLLAGGLIAEKRHVVSALQAGAVGISASSQQIWNL